MESTLLTAIALPFLGIPLLALLGPALGRRAGWVALPVAAVSFALVLFLAIGNEGFGRRLVEAPWIPSLGVGLQFMVDGLSLFFGLVVAGMGVLVIFYACSYLDDHYEFHGRFYASLLFFMGAMLGTVFSDNLMLLFVFWELTGISSFLLIGFLNRSAVSRAGARMALLTTGLTGLVLLAGIVLTGHAASTLRLSEMMSGAVPGGDAFLFNAAFVLIAIGAFGKSAQVPFHFWLPNAMAAPTPVSAYLHSATMVN